MGRELQVRKAPIEAIRSFKCPSCFDYGIVLLTERTIIGVADLMDNSMPCTCPAGDQWKKEYPQ